MKIYLQLNLALQISIKQQNATASVRSQFKFLRQKLSSFSYFEKHVEVLHCTCHVPPSASITITFHTVMIFLESIECCGQSNNE